jgi:phosphoribosylglycinamide formyltransferase-1
VFARCDDARADLVCLAGWLSLLALPASYQGRVMNIHPALLPGFGGKGMYGHNVHAAVLAHGCRVSGCTVHFVDERYDNGPIIVQRTCPVLDDDTPDTLAHRVFEEEKIAYPEAIRLFQEGRLRVEGRRVRIADH